LCKAKARDWTKHHAIVEDTAGDAWGNEGTWREKLWQQATELAGPRDWLFILDSDFVLTFDPHELTHTDSNYWRFDLYDMWSETHYRSDNVWKAHRNPRPWMFRVDGCEGKPEFNTRGIHTGHAPQNFKYRGFSVAPGRCAILHLGWSTPEIRQEKYERYLSVKDMLTPFEIAHNESVMDENPNLVELPESMRRCLKETV
jgi:hypothetical protein